MEDKTITKNDKNSFEMTVFKQDSLIYVHLSQWRSSWRRPTKRDNYTYSQQIDARHSRSHGKGEREGCASIFSEVEI